MRHGLIPPAFPHESLLLYPAARLVKYIVAYRTMSQVRDSASDYGDVHVRAVGAEGGWRRGQVYPASGRVNGSTARELGVIGLGSGAQ